MESRTRDQSWPSTIRDLRLNLGLTQVQLAKRLWVDETTIQRWEAGTSRPRSRATIRHINRMVNKARKEREGGV